jgi:hypothetical protein
VAALLCCQTGLQPCRAAASVALTTCCSLLQQVQRCRDSNALRGSGDQGWWLGCPAGEEAELYGANLCSDPRPPTFAETSLRLLPQTIAWALTWHSKASAQPFGSGRGPGLCTSWPPPTMPAITGRERVGPPGRTLRMSSCSSAPTQPLGQLPWPGWGVTREKLSELSSLGLGPGQ